MKLEDAKKRFQLVLNRMNKELKAHKNKDEIVSVGEPQVYLDGWLFSWQGKKFLTTQNEMDRLLPNSPIYVDYMGICYDTWLSSDVGGGLTLSEINI
jgi:hypothetical protein